MTLRLVRASNGHLQLQKNNQKGGEVPILPALREHASPSIRGFLANNGELKITKIVCCRKPIYSTIQRIVDLIPSRLRPTLEKTPYSKLFHLFLLITLENGKTIKLEKNHVPELASAQPDVPEGTESISVKAPTGSIADFIEKGEASAPSKRDFWVYDAVDANCQWFVEWLLKGSHVLTPALHSFLFQEVKKVLDRFGFFKKVARQVTDIAGQADVLLKGRGRRKKLMDKSRSKAKKACN